MAVSLSFSKSLTNSRENWCCTDAKTTTFSYLWTINKFALCHEKKKIKSSIFRTGTSGNEKWYLKMVPTKKEKNYVNIYLVLDFSEKTNVQTQFELSILNNKHEKCNIKRKDCARFKRYLYWGFERFMNIDDLFNEANNWLINNILTICCEINVITEIFNTSGQNILNHFDIPEFDHKSSMEQLLQNKKFSDIIISVKGHKFHAHKCILALRSPVFAATFEHNMGENKNNKIDITDMKPEVMKELLYFIYTGDVYCLREMATDLLIAADKYDLNRLKTMCEKSLSTSLSINTALNIFILANRYNAEQLKNQTLDFIIQHTKEISKTHEWKSIVMQCPNLIPEAFQTLISRQVNKANKRKTFGLSFLRNRML